MIKRVGTVITNILILIVILLNLLILGYIGGLVIKHVLQKKGTEKPFLPAESTDPDGTLELDESSKNLEQIDTSDWERQYEILMAFEKKWQKTDTTIDRDLPEEKRMEEISGIVNKAIEEAFQMSPHQLHEVLMKEAELYALMEKKKTEEDQKIIAVFNEKFEFHEMNNSQEKEDMTEKERKEQLRLRAVQDTAKELKIEEEHVQIVIGM
jgi:hypothetical protein